MRLSIRRNGASGIVRRRCRRHRFAASGVLLATGLTSIAIEPRTGTARATKVGRPVRTRRPIEVAVLLVRWPGDCRPFLVLQVIGELVATAVAIARRGRRFWFTFGAAHSNPHPLQG